MAKNTGFSCEEAPAWADLVGGWVARTDRQWRRSEGSSKERETGQRLGAAMG